MSIPCLLELPDFQIEERLGDGDQARSPDPPLKHRRISHTILDFFPIPWWFF